MAASVSNFQHAAKGKKSAIKAIHSTEAATSGALELSQISKECIARTIWKFQKIMM